MNDISKQICDAVEIIVDQRLATADYSKTAQASIEKCIDPEIGKYKCWYQGALVDAYASNPSLRYAPGAVVSILLPNNNNNNKDKIILGTTKRGNILPSIVEVLTDEEKYVVVGRNCISKMNESVSFPDIKDTETKEINIDFINTDEIKEYVQSSSYIKCVIDIDVDIDDNDKKNASYQVNFNLKFVDNEEPIPYIVSINDIIGNPYKTGGSQYVIFEVPNSDKFEGITSVVGIATGLSANSKVDIKGIEFYALRLASLKELEGYAIGFETPDGYLLSNNNTITINPALYNKRFKLTDAAVKYLWFEEDMSKTTKEDESSTSKAGWVKMEAEGSLTLENNAFDSKEARYRCACVYGEETVEDIFTVKKLNSNYTLSIVSSEGTSFQQNYSGNTTLTCKINDDEVKEDYNYYWAEYTQDGQFKAHKGENNTLEVVIPSIANSSTFVCTVKEKKNDNTENLIGSTSIVITNMVTDDAKALIINNGTMLFNYNSKGELRKKVKKDDDPATLLEKENGVEEISVYSLSFKLKTDNEEITDKIPQGMSIQWTIYDNSLLSFVKGQPVEGIPEEEEQIIIYQKQENIITGVSTVDYMLEKAYDEAKDRNQIDLRIDYQGKTYLATTNFTINKAEPVTNMGDMFVQETSTSEGADQGDIAITEKDGGEEVGGISSSDIVYWAGGPKKTAPFKVTDKGVISAAGYEPTKENYEGFTGTIEYVTDIELIKNDNDEITGLAISKSVLTFDNGWLITEKTE